MTPWTVVSGSVGMSLGDGVTGLLSCMSCADMNAACISKMHSVVAASITFLAMVFVNKGKGGTV